MVDYWEVHFRTPDGKNLQKGVPADRNTKQEAIDAVKENRDDVAEVLKVVRA